MNPGEYPFLRNPWWIVSVLLFGAGIYWIAGKGSEESEAIIEVVQDEKPEGLGGPTSGEISEAISGSLESSKSLSPLNDERLAKIEDRLTEYRKERLEDEAQSTPPETREHGIYSTATKRYGYASSNEEYSRNPKI